ncbi:MAG: hypothetical protein A2148_02900 [Chloroflexi bacterium RBG_16_68_14]|nr:MAG: hypothetical protein A2148_02900 [Chloroflexi bacterium RBG_16_68_14]
MFALLLLVGLLVVAGVEAADQHADDACPAQSWSLKTEPEQFWFKVVTACNDHPAQELEHIVFIQYFDWSAGQWVDHPGWPPPFGTFGGSRLNTDFYGSSRYRQVTAYGGYACYRVRTKHWVIEWSKNWYREDESYSLGQCY